MAYQSKNLSALGYANGFTLWHYRTEDSFEELKGAGYFNAAGRMVRVGDFILLNAAVKSEKPENGSVCVTASDGQTVSVAE